MKAFTKRLPQNSTVNIEGQNLKNDTVPYMVNKNRLGTYENFLTQIEQFERVHNNLLTLRTLVEMHLPQYNNADTLCGGFDKDGLATINEEMKPQFKATLEQFPELLNETLNLFYSHDTFIDTEIDDEIDDEEEGNLDRLNNTIEEFNKRAHLKEIDVEIEKYVSPFNQTFNANKLKTYQDMRAKFLEVAETLIITSQYVIGLAKIMAEETNPFIYGEFNLPAIDAESGVDSLFQEQQDQQVQKPEVKKDPPKVQRKEQHQKPVVKKEPPKVERKEQHQKPVVKIDPPKVQRKEQHQKPVVKIDPPKVERKEQPKKPVVKIDPPKVQRKEQPQKSVVKKDPPKVQRKQKQGPLVFNPQTIEAKVKPPIVIDAEKNANGAGNFGGESSDGSTEPDLAALFPSVPKNNGLAHEAQPRKLLAANTIKSLIITAAVTVLVAIVAVVITLATGGAASPLAAFLSSAFLAGISNGGAAALSALLFAGLTAAVGLIVSGVIEAVTRYREKAKYTQYQPLGEGLDEIDFTSEEGNPLVNVAKKDISPKRAQQNTEKMDRLIAEQYARFGNVDQAFSGQNTPQNW